MIVFAGLDWLWWALTLAGVFAAGAVPFWMHGRAATADAYAAGWDDRETAELGRHAVVLDNPTRAPGKQTFSYMPGLGLPPEREWAEITADWMAPEARAELAAWVQEMTLRAA